MGVGATVGLAAKGLLPDSSIPTAATAGPSTSVQHAPAKAVVMEKRVPDRLSMTVPLRVNGREGEASQSVGETEGLSKCLACLQSDRGSDLQ